MKRVIVQKNGTSGNGKLIFLGESLEMLLHEANRVLNMSSNIVFTEKGGVVEDIRVIRDDEVLYLSEGEQFIDPRYAVTTRPYVNQCNTDEASFYTDQNDWVSLNVGGKRFTTTSSPANSLPTGSPMKVTPHMSEVERNILMALVNQYRDVIESRRNDSTAIQRKAIAWAYVEREYNAQPMVRHRRTKKQLRKAYENLKMRSKKDVMKKLVKLQQEPITPTSDMQPMITETEIPAEIRTLLNPYEADDNPYQGDTSASVQDDSLSGNEEQSEMVPYLPHLQHISKHSNIHRDQVMEVHPETMKNAAATEGIPMHCRSTEITTKPLTKMYSSISTLPVPNIPQVQLVSPVTSASQEPMQDRADPTGGNNVLRNIPFHSSLKNSFQVCQELQEEKYRPDIVKIRSENSSTDNIDSYDHGNEDISKPVNEEDVDEHGQENKNVQLDENAEKEELEILILRTKLENERREHKLRIQLLHQQLRFWKKKTLNLNNMKD